MAAGAADFTPYYAAIILSLLVTALIPGLRDPGITCWNEALPIWNRGVLVSHFLLVQNWSPDWVLKIDPPAWTVAVEAQIYMIFILVLLPLSRRIGVAATAVAALWAGQEVHWYFAGIYDAIYWSYIGMFALGMLGATISFSEATWAKCCRSQLPWGAFTFIIWAVVFRLLVSPGQEWVHYNCWLTDPLVGVATCCLLVYGTQALTVPSPGPLPWIVRLLQAKPLVQIGGFSYSFYLMHDPILAIMQLALQPLKLAYPTGVWVMLVLCLLVAVPAAYLFSLWFEHPFMSAHQATAKNAARAAIVSPAP